MKKKNNVSANAIGKYISVSESDTVHRSISADR